MAMFRIESLGSTTLGDAVYAAAKVDSKGEVYVDDSGEVYASALKVCITRADLLDTLSDWIDQEVR